MSGSAPPSALGPRWARWAGHLLAGALWRLEVTGAANVPVSGPVLFAANHTDVIDGPLLVSASPRPAHVLVKDDMFAGPIGLVLRASGQIPVDRESGRRALLTAIAVLRRGGVVGVFPEGSRGRGDAAQARAGVAWLALTASAPVIPVALLGARRTGESVEHIPGLRRRLVVEFGAPVQLGAGGPGTTGRAGIAHANEAIRVALSALIESASARTGVVLPADDPSESAARSE